MANKMKQWISHDKIWKTLLRLEEIIAIADYVWKNVMYSEHKLLNKKVN